MSFKIDLILLIAPKELAQVYNCNKIKSRLKKLFVEKNKLSTTKIDILTNLI